MLADPRVAAARLHPLLLGAMRTDASRWTAWMHEERIADAGTLAARLQPISDVLVRAETRMPLSPAEALFLLREQVFRDVPSSPYKTAHRRTESGSTAATFIEHDDDGAAADGGGRIEPRDLFSVAVSLVTDRCDGATTVEDAPLDERERHRRAVERLLRVLGIDADDETMRPREIGHLRTISASRIEAVLADEAALVRSVHRATASFGNALGLHSASP